MHTINDIDPNQLPMVTILIANYNYGKYLDHAINSALNQTYPKKGIVIVDDCSQDNSWQLIHDKLFKDNKFEEGENEVCDYKIMRMPSNVPNVLVTIFAIRLKNNSGPSEARNVGISMTKEATDIYAILDADDELHPEKLTICVACLLQSEQIGVVYADYDILDEGTGNILREYKEPFSHKRLLQECIVHSGALIKVTALDAVRDNFGWYDREMRTCEDYDLWMRISEKFMICHVPQALTLVRNQSQNSTMTVDKSIWEGNWQRIAQKARMRHAQQ